MDRLIQRFKINRGAKLVNKINLLISEGKVRQAEKLKKKLPMDDQAKMYWISSRARKLRIRNRGV